MRVQSSSFVQPPFFTSFGRISQNIDSFFFWDSLFVFWGYPKFRGHQTPQEGASHSNHPLFGVILAATTEATSGFPVRRAIWIWLREPLRDG